MRRRWEKAGATVLALGLTTTALSSCVGGGEATAGGADAEAPPAEWRLWALSSPDEIAVPPPPRGGAPLERAERLFGAGAGGDRVALARWDRNPVPAPWVERAMDFVALRPKDPPYSSRAYAYVAVAMYDAAIAASYWRDRYGARTYPDGQATIAGAASRVLAYLFTEHPAQRLDADAEEAARAAVAAGESRPADAMAGLGLGRQVAAHVIARARSDGATTPWNGNRPPLRPRYWAPPPGSAAKPVEPMAGTWRTWVIGSPARFRAPPPPRYGSAEFERGVRTLLAAKQRLTDEQRRAALFWAGGQGTALPAGIWEGVIIEYLRHRHLTLEEQTRVLALVSVAMADAGVASWDAKYRYWYPRPENAIRDTGADRNWKPLIPTPFFPAYTSGHATYSAAAAEVLSYLFPAEAEEWHRKAREAADARIWGGIHWPWDSEAGLEAGREIGKLVVEQAKRDGANP